MMPVRCFPQHQMKGKQVPIRAANSLHIKYPAFQFMIPFYNVIDPVIEILDKERVGGFYMFQCVGKPGAGMHKRIMFHVQHRLVRSEEHTSELQSLMRISYAVFCLKKKKLHT